MRQSEWVLKRMYRDKKERLSEVNWETEVWEMDAGKRA